MDFKLTNVSQKFVVNASKENTKENKDSKTKNMNSPLTTEPTVSLCIRALEQEIFSFRFVQTPSDPKMYSSSLSETLD